MINLAELKSFNITEEQLKLTGKHPGLGVVTLSQIFSAWTVHDMGHIVQISRVMAK
jgi:hypothetical protein